MSKIDRTKIQKENILNSSYELFRDKGYNKATTREIADSAGIRPGLLHYYYRKKEDILADLYDNLLGQILNFLIDVGQITESGLVYIAIFDIFYYKVISSHPYLNKLIAEVLSSRSLTKIKIDRTMALYQKVCQNFGIPITDKDLFLPTAVAIGAEVELLLNIMDGNLEMSYDELAGTIIKLEFLMLKVDDKKIQSLIETAAQVCEKIDVRKFDAYFHEQCPWCGN